MTLLVAIFVVLVWAAPLGLWFQGARRIAGLPTVEMSAETSDAARRAVRRSSALAAAITVVFGSAAWALASAGLDTAARGVLQAGSFGGFHLAYWWGGAPLLRIGRRVTTVAPEPSRRTASLVVRDPESVLPARWWVIPALLLAAAPLVAAWLALAGAPPDSQAIGIVAVATVVGGSMLAGWGLWARSVASSPQDLSGAADPAALDRACAAFRRSLSRGIAWLAAATAAMTALVAVAALFTAGDPVARNLWCALGGGIGGSLIGCGGGVLGAIADRHRRAILELGGLPPDAALIRSRQVVQDAAS